MKINKEVFGLLIAKKEMTLIQLAEKSKVSRFTLTRINSGFDVTPITVGRVANALDVPVETLIKEEE